MYETIKMPDAYCIRAHVVCVIDGDGFVFRTMNGPWSVWSHTRNTWVGRQCTGVEGECGCEHAEARALRALFATGHYGPVYIHCTYTPCRTCAEAIIAAHNGSTRVIEFTYEREYRLPVGLSMLVAAGIDVRKVDSIPPPRMQRL